MEHLDFHMYGPRSKFYFYLRTDTLSQSEAERRNPEGRALNINMRCLAYLYSLQRLQTSGEQSSHKKQWMLLLISRERKACVCTF